MKTFLLILTLCLLPLNALAQTTNIPETKDPGIPATINVRNEVSAQLFRNARELYLKGDLKGSVEIFKRMLSINCSDTLAQYHLQKIAARGESFKDVQEFLTALPCPQHDFKKEDFLPASLYYEPDADLMLDQLVARQERDRAAQASLAQEITRYSKTAAELETKVTDLTSQLTAAQKDAAEKDATRQKAAQLEAEKHAALLQETAKQNAALLEAKQQNAALLEAAKQNEAQLEIAKQNTALLEAAKQEVAKLEAEKLEAEKQVAAKLAEIQKPLEPVATPEIAAIQEQIKETEITANQAATQVRRLTRKQRRSARIRQKQLAEIHQRLDSAMYLREKAAEESARPYAQEIIAANKDIATSEEHISQQTSELETLQEKFTNIQKRLQTITGNLTSENAAIKALSSELPAAKE